MSRTARMEQHESEVKTVQVEHTDNSHFVINSAALRNAQLHRRISNLSFNDITPQEWVACVESGFDAWAQAGDEELESEEEEMGEVDYSEDEEASGVE